MTNRLIAIDADGVMVDYISAYANAYELAFGVKPKVVNPNSYWAMDRYDIPSLEERDLEHFKSFINTPEFWFDVPALPGALEAVQKLWYAGYDIVCVTAMSESFRSSRHAGLQYQGFPILHTYAVGAPKFSTESYVHEGSPKKATINYLNPIVFVDDYRPYHEGINPDIHKALITREDEGSPNDEYLNIVVDSQHKNLLEFADWFLGRWDYDDPYQ